MSKRAQQVFGDLGRVSDRWMAEIRYRDGRPPKIVTFEELEDLDEIVERGPDWRTIENIVITLNSWSRDEDER